jgi:hypothetical protein
VTSIYFVELGRSCPEAIEAEWADRAFAKGVVDVIVIGSCPAPRGASSRGSCS